MNHKYHLLTILLAITTSVNIYGQNTKGIRAEYSKLAKNTTLPVIHSNKDKILVINNNTKITWTITPSARPDILESYSKDVYFVTDIDTLHISVEEGGKYDFVILNANNDSAFTRVQWVANNPLENTPKELGTLSPSGKLSRQQALYDIDALAYTISETHPDMFAVTGHEKLMQKLLDIENQVTDSIDIANLYKMLMPWVTSIGDAHTGLQYPVNSIFTQELRRFPVIVKVTDDYKIIVKACHNDLIPIDAEITSINGIDTKEMLTLMMQYVSGERDFYKLNRISDDFLAYFHLLFTNDNYEIEHKLKGEKKSKTITVPSISFEDSKQLRLGYNKRNAIATSNKDNYSFQILKDKSIAIMDFRSFWDVDRMKNFADSMFMTLKEQGIRNLIIDIRENGGGNSRVGDELLRYISPKPFCQFAKTYVRITPTSRRMMQGNDITPGISFYNNNQLTESYYGTDKYYDGNVILLTSHHTFSSANSFAWAFKYFGCGTVIGEETGGMNVSFGDILMYTLPISNLKCSISFKRFWLYGADEKDIHGTLPDISVAQEDALDTAFKVINKGKKNKKVIQPR
ncbi:MAG: hypothetical protein IKQ72_11085 [Bacteroidaceae bacterium]|nr:hypothetical protein [Bacteroidaceae bacterium]